jgi:rhomboid family GlyGly-CTERM serine protease
MHVTARLSAGRDALERIHATGARGGLLALLLAAIVLPQWLGGDALAIALRYDRTAVTTGEFFRLLTGQFVHLDRLHAFANAAGAVMIWALVGGAFSAGRWLWVIVMSLLTVAAGLWWLSPEVAWYVGASGMLHGLLAAGAVTQAARGDPLARLVLLIVAAKLLWEQWSGPLPFAGDSVVVVDAHLYGFVGGVLAAILRRPAQTSL